MTEMSEILLYLVIFGIGGIFGFMLCRITFGKKQAAAQQQELEDSKAELEHYKSQVNEHFTNSAELMEQVASSYQALYSHMAGQSQTLLGDSEMLPFAQLQSLAEKEQQAPDEVEEVLQTDAAQETEQAVPKRAEPQTETTEQAPESSAEKSEAEERAPESNAEKTETAEQAAESSAEKTETAEQAAEGSAEKTETGEQAAEGSEKDTERSEEVPSKTAQK